MVNQILHDLYLVLSLAIRLEEARSKEQSQVLGTHLVQVGTLLNPEGNKEPANRVWVGCNVSIWRALTESNQSKVDSPGTR